MIGVDLGGTKIKTGAINGDGKVLCTPVQVPTGGQEPAELIIKRITDSVGKILSRLELTTRNVAGIGIGSTGPLDIDAGMILECPQLPTMHFFPLRNTIRDHFKVPVFMNNDANCLIYGESIFGAASTKKDVVGFTLGTGIGCAVVLNHQLRKGTTGTAAEIWPSPYLSGTIEDYISGAGVSRIYKSISGMDKSSLDIYNLAVNGDEQALKTWNEFGTHLAVPIAWAINLLDPDVVVLGGSVAGAYQFFKPSMEENIRKWVCPVPARETKVVLAGLGENAGFIGAACLVIENTSCLDK
ncbi:MAG: ROK family protein [Bacteroidota bacterium]